MKTKFLSLFLILGLSIFGTQNSFAPTPSENEFSFDDPFSDPMTNDVSAGDDLWPAGENNTSSMFGEIGEDGYQDLFEDEGTTSSEDDSEINFDAAPEEDESDKNEHDE